LGNVILTGQQADIKALEIAGKFMVNSAGVMFHSDSNNAGVSLYHHSVCRLTRLV
jgi:putative transposase